MSRTPCCHMPIEGRTIYHQPWCPEARATRQYRLMLLVALLVTVLLLCGISSTGDLWDTTGWVP